MLQGLMLLEQCRGGWCLRSLCNHVGGRPVTYANDLDIAADGKIYFSDSSVIPPALNEAAPMPW
jgi:sugar lactone lactonase YvrE